MHAYDQRADGLPPSIVVAVLQPIHLGPALLTEDAPYQLRELTHGVQSAIGLAGINYCDLRAAWMGPSGIVYGYLRGIGAGEINDS
jgi:hypothetical protein